MKLISIEEHFLTKAVSTTWDKYADIIETDRILFSSDYAYQYRPGRDARNFL